VEGRVTTILVVEDEIDARELLVSGLGRHGYAASSAVDGQDALDKLKGIDVLLTDLVMPRLDGLSVLAAVREAAPNALRIVLTSFGDKERVIAALNLGADYLIEKPFSISQLHEVIQRLLQERDGADGLAGIFQARMSSLNITEREQRLITYVLKGLPNKEIAALTSVSEQSVKNSLFYLYRKLGVSSRSELFHLIFPI
jgi:DNA-binding NarL/FixJ family response regulator